MENSDKLVAELIKLPTETEWLEFKDSNYDPEMIGQDISALANSAVLSDRDHAYMIWGVNDTTHEIIGTDYNQYSKLNKNQEIESWLRNLLSKNADFEFQQAEIDTHKIIILVINKALCQTVTFKKTDYIRVGSYTKKLNEYPSLQARLWDRLCSTHFECPFAKKDLQENKVLNYLDFPVYFNLQEKPLPASQKTVFHYMLEDCILVRQDNGLYAITNLGAILLAKHLSDFPTIARKAIRVVLYQDDTRLKILKENDGNKGYAAGFEGLIQFLEALLPSEENIEDGLRKTKTTYPMIAVREIIANALMHQDFSIAGTGPLVEIFKSRIEITNPGIPLIDIMRIIDNPPKSRNEKLAALMRRLKMCEELGSGWDRIVTSCESYQLQAPKINLYEENTKVIIYSKIPYTNMQQDDRIWSCYLHACIKQVAGDGLTNSSLRKRFGLPDTASAAISRLIKDAVSQKLIKPFDPDTAPRYMKYVPFWA
jgi:ATP-dependent DNA helicase RecG